MGNDYLVRLNLDRNGNVSSIQPEAVVLKENDSVTYQLQEPSATNWKFIGVQFASDAQLFGGVQIEKDTQLTLSNHIAQGQHQQVELTLLYVLADTGYYGSGDDPSLAPPRAFKAKNSVHAFDPLVILEN